MTLREFDGFEDGDFTNNPSWSESGAGGTSQVVGLSDDSTGIDGFESGSSQLGFENQDANITIDSGGEVYGDNSLQISSSNANITTSILSFNESITTDGKIIKGSFKADAQQGATVLNFYQSGDNIPKFQLRFNSDGSINITGTDDIGTWSVGEIIDFEIILDSSNNEVDVRLNGSTVATDSGTGGYNSIDQIEVNLNTTSTGGTQNTFLDRLTYTSNAEDSVNTTLFKNGIKSLELIDTDGRETVSYDRGVNGGYIADGDIYQYWVLTEQTDEESSVEISNDISRLGSDAIVIVFPRSDGITVNSWDSSGSFIDEAGAISTRSASTWYRCDLEVNPSVPEATLRVYDVEGNLLGEATVPISDVLSRRYVNLGVLGESRTSAEVQTRFDDASYGDATSFNDSIGVSANVSLSKARLTGKVELPKGVGVSGAEVYAYNKTQGTFEGYDTTDSNGDYSIAVGSGAGGDEILVAADYIGPERTDTYATATSSVNSVQTIETLVTAKDPLYVDEAWFASAGGDVTVEIENTSGTVVASKTETVGSGTSSITFTESDYSELVEGDFTLRITSNAGLSESSQQSYESGLLSISNQTHSGFFATGDNDIFSVVADGKAYGEEKSIKYEKTS